MEKGRKGRREVKEKRLARRQSWQKMMRTKRKRWW
jgi:hypothetical protein